MNTDVVILLSAYNGKDYIAEQLESIWKQTYPGKIITLVRDDGSKDETPALVEGYPHSENREFRLLRGENVRPQRSFLELIRLAPEAGFYFFADQDDVWDADKIEIAVAQLQAVQGPACYCSNFRLSHTDLSVYREQALAQAPKFTPLQVLFYNKIPGCVMGFNRALMVLLQQLRLKNVMMHDSMTLCLAAACGQVLYDPAPRISHRIHGNNVVGDGHKKIRLHKWIPEKLKLLFGKEDYDLSEMARQFLNAAGDQMPEEYRADLELLRDFKKKRKFTRQLLRHPDTQGRRFDRTVMSIRCKIFFHIF
jgi:rhamnosyltransferase